MIPTEVVRVCFALYLWSALLVLFKIETMANRSNPNIVLYAQKPFLKQLISDTKLTKYAFNLRILLTSITNTLQWCDKWPERLFGTS